MLGSVQALPAALSAVAGGQPHRRQPATHIFELHLGGGRSDESPAVYQIESLAGSLEPARGSSDFRIDIWVIFISSSDQIQVHYDLVMKFNKFILGSIHLY